MWTPPTRSSPSIPNTEPIRSPSEQDGTRPMPSARPPRDGMLGALTERVAHSGRSPSSPSPAPASASIDMAPLLEAQNARQPDARLTIIDHAQRLVSQLAISPRPGEAQIPVPDAWHCLKAIDSMCRSLDGARLAEAERELQTALAQSSHSLKDKDLLLDVVAEITRPNGRGLHDYMAARAFTGLCLPNLQLLEKGEREPNARTFNSVLSYFAESTHDYNPLGRTLLWEGACKLFDGPRGEQRREKLRKVIFSFPNVVKEGQQKLEHSWDFMMAVDELKVDEDIDVDALKKRLDSSSSPESNPS